MKAYFTASISGKKLFEENYRKIFSTLKNLEVDVLSDHVLKTDFKDIKEVTPAQEKEFYQQMNDWINQADVVIAEVSQQSTSVGHEVTLAFSKNKPVIALHTKDKRTIILEGTDSEKLQLVPYDFDDLEEKLREALELASGAQDTRFNFFISPRHQAYLDWIARERKIPRSVFLRRLIEEHMRKNKDYSEA